MLHKKNYPAADRIREIIVQNSRGFGKDWEFCTVQGPIKVTRNCVLYKTGFTDRQLAIKLFHPAHTSPGQVKKYYSALCEYYQNMDTEKGLLVPRPYKIIQEQRILIMDWIPGPSLGRQLLRPDFSGGLRENCIRAAARWLQRFHKAGGVRKFSLDTRPILDKLQNSLQRAELGKKIFGMDSKLEQIYKTIYNCSYLAEEVYIPHAPVHADFTPNNLFYDSQSIWGIDFLPRKKAPVTEDICRFLAYLNVYRLKFVSSRSLLQEYRYDREVFIDAYQRTGIERSLLDWLQLVEVLRRLASVKSQLNSRLRQPLRLAEMRRLEKFAGQLSGYLDAV